MSKFDNSKPLRVLIVEDEALLAEQLQDRLARNHYQVVDMADTAPRAVEAARTWRPDLVLMDIRLKNETDGIEAALQIYGELGIPAIFLTAHSDRLTLSRAVQAAQFGYLVKPVREQDLVIAIEMAISRHEIERRMKEREVSHLAIIEAAAEAIVGLDGEARIRSWNPAAQRMFGYSCPEVLGRHISILAAPGCEEPMAELLRRVWAGTRIDRYETVRTRKDGSFVDVSLSSSPVRDPDGTIVGAVGVFRDITEEKRAAEALRISEARLKVVVEGMPILLVALNEADVPVAWNSECERVTGYSAAECVGNPGIWTILCPDPDYRGRMLSDLRINAEDSRGRAWKIVCKDSSVRTIEWSSISERFPIPGWTFWAVGLDVTDRLKLEEDLRQGQKMQALGQLAGGVAHDFNNLLTVINGNASMVHGMLANQPDLRRRVDYICNAGKAAAAITDQLLAFSQKRVVKAEILDINQVLSASRPILQQLLGSRITLEIYLSPNLKPILGTESGIQQILINLTANARDAMPKGGRLSIRTASLDGRPPGVTSKQPSRLFNVITVQDSGHGIQPELHSKIFEPFFTSKPLGKGTGLGLATVWGIVSQRGGWIQVDSKPGEGTKFDVYLPVAEGFTTKTSSGTMPRGSATEAGTCLLVDDEPAIRELCAEFLRSRGWNVLEAGDALSALEASRNHPDPIDLLISDIVMPGMSGVDLATRIQVERPGIGVVLITGYAPDASAVPEGIQVLPKPFSRGQLIAAATAARLVGNKQR